MSATTAVGSSSAPSSRTASRCALARADRRLCRARAGLGPLRPGSRAAARASPPSTIGFAHYLRAPESFTPDSNLQLGFVPEVPGLFVAAGLNSQGIIFGPGVGKAAAEWILEGHPTMDLVEVDVARTGRWASQRRWLHERTVETLGGLYAMHWPGKQPYDGAWPAPPAARRGASAAGAALGQVGGWERPLWFEPGVGARDPLRLRDPSWFPAVRDEVRATREGVALYDLRPTPSSSSQVRERWPVCTARHLGPRRAAAGSCTRSSPTSAAASSSTRRSPASTTTRSWSSPRPSPSDGCEGLLRNGLPPDAVVTDVTSGWATLHIAGPRSRELLARLTDDGRRSRRMAVPGAARSRSGGPGLGVPRFVHRGARLGAVRADRVRRRPVRALVAAARTSVCATPARSRSRRPGWSVVSARGATTWARRRPIRGRSRFTVSRRKTVDFVDARRSTVAAIVRPERRLVAVHAPAPCSARRVDAPRRRARRPRHECLLPRPWRLGRPGLGPRPPRRRPWRSRSAATPFRAGSAATRSTTRAGSACARRGCWARCLARRIPSSAQTSGK